MDKRLFLKDFFTIDEHRSTQILDENSLKNVLKSFSSVFTLAPHASAGVCGELNLRNAFLVRFSGLPRTEAGLQPAEPLDLKRNLCPF
jgi:hypothetical protein